MSHTIYKTIFSHNDIYQDNSIVPQYCVGYIVTTTNVRISFSDEPRLNTLSTARLLNILSDLRTLEHSSIPTLRQAEHQKLFPGTIYFEQCDISTLLTLYEPLLTSLARNAHSTTSRYFLYDDLLQDVKYIVVYLYRKGYYIHGRLIKQTFLNYVRKKLRKEPTHYSMLSFEDLQPNKNSDNSLTLEDTLVDPISSTFTDDIVLSDARQQLIKEQRDYVLTVVSPRTYDQMLREYRTNTVPTSNGKFIREIQYLLNINNNKNNINNNKNNKRR